MGIVQSLFQVVCDHEFLSQASRFDHRSAIENEEVKQGEEGAVTINSYPHIDEILLTSSNSPTDVRRSGSHRYI